MMRSSKVTLFLSRHTCGSTSPGMLFISMMMSTDLLADFGPRVLTMAVRNALSSVIEHCATSAPYRAAGRMVALIVWAFCACVMGSSRSLCTHLVACLSLFVSVVLLLVRSKQRWAPRSRKWLTTLMVMAGCVVSLVLVWLCWFWWCPCLRVPASATSTA